ncbi:sigma-70 family RNA polymerase sigma factor [Pontibacillus salipaludis]|uniref:RNA polymerase sigma factor SigV n=1 Tax=Pontibacillus salipaludis TaxID=1697394 RepID=A0ABQ1Q840_9BACI|nr:sigma-70 family RNA polymerase sigma factor [Pontibacillus salipaludis]GGD18546.1 RNA polymerase sigma factor SigV [Pontibacillus salipaludis]
MKKAQKGNEKAFVELFSQYQEDIYRISYTYVKNQNDALDVVQEVAYRSFKKMDTLKHPEYFKTWLIKMAITCSIDLIRKNKKVITIDTNYENYIGTEDQDTALSITLHELLDKLNEEEKSIIILKFYQGYTFKEIADILEIPLGTAKSNMYRALQKLRNDLGEVGRCE